MSMPLEAHLRLQRRFEGKRLSPGQFTQMPALCDNMPVHRKPCLQSARELHTTNIKSILPEVGLIIGVVTIRGFLALGQLGRPANMSTPQWDVCSRALARK